VAQCRKCKLCETRAQNVFGSGKRQAKWTLIGEALGQQEDLQGLPKANAFACAGIARFYNQLNYQNPAVQLILSL
jgi:hypothetical protein